MKSPLRGAKPIYTRDGKILYWRKDYKDWHSAEQAKKKLMKKYDGEYKIEVIRFGKEGIIYIRKVSEDEV